ncbi:MAG: tyrosinase family protein [Marinobacter sp.]|nr:tyrosinase family protein [Marinobacter sp.]
MNLRKEINALTDTELQRLRSAMSQLQAAAGAQSYQYLAGLHGLPNPSHCPHNLPEFLPWHRLYILEFEQALQRFEPEVTLPYWDWTSEKAIANGLPPALDDESFVDSTGQTQPNPLRQAWIEFESRWTSRGAGGRLEIVAFLADQVADARDVQVFYEPGSPNDFSSALENPHGGIHGWIGNDMAAVSHAAFDPVFWLHHCNIDRIWAEWQYQNPDVELPAELLSRNLAVFDRPIADTLDNESLNVVYDTILRQQRRPKPPEIHVNTLNEPANLLAEPQAHQQRLVTINGLRMTRKSFELRVFANLPQGEADLSFTSPHFVGSIFLLGMGDAVNPKGFRGEFRRTLNLVPALQRTGHSQLESISAKLFDLQGNEHPAEAVLPHLEISEP